MSSVSRCCNLVIAALYKVDFANTHRYSSPAYTSMLCGWNKSTKTVIKSKKIKDIVIRKKLHSNMGATPGDKECREYTRSIELQNFDPRKIYKKL